MTDFSVPSHERHDADTPLSLLLRLKANDQAAWERLVSLYSPLVYRWCRQEGLQAADAADVGQEVFQAVAHYIQDFRRDRPGDSFRRWLRAITRTKVCDYYRQHGAFPAVGGEAALDQLQQMPADHEAGEATEESNEKAVLFRRAVELIRSEFEEVTWQAFWHTAVEGRRPTEVAAELRISANSVYLAKSRILRRFREEFQDLVDPEVS